MIDLHTHTNESDGTLSPAGLVAHAAALGIEALGITDHDTFAGYEAAVEHARSAGLELVCGIEMSTRLATGGRRASSVHVLGYFLHHEPSEPFRAWLSEVQSSRRDRNRRLIARLRSLGIDIELREVEALGRTLTGRPHFARVLVEKGYVRTTQEAFREYLDESAKGYVPRDEPTVEDCIRRIREAGGVSSLAHPVRLGFRNLVEEEALIEGFAAGGLQALEAYHSDHNPDQAARYAALAQRFGLAITGGSDFHGANKPEVRLGAGRDGNLAISRQVLDELREATADSR